MRVLPLILIGAAAAMADRIENSVKDAAPSGLLAGVARADISPPVGIPQMNWGAQTHVTAEAIDPAGMWATALVLSDGRSKFAMVDIDALFVAPLGDVAERAAKLTGIPADHIRLGATHTHAGPLLTGAKGPVGLDLQQFRPMYDRHWQSVADRVVGAIAQANASLEPAHIGGAKGIGTININRRVRPRDGAPPAVGRNPEGLVDRDLIVARIDNAQGHPLAVIVNFQCHGTVLAWENKAISPDWPGMMRKEVEHALPGSKCLFFQGAAGNQGPVEGFTGDLAVPHRLGRILGHQAAALALEIETVRREPKFEGFVESTAYIAKQYWRTAGPRDGTLAFASKVIDVPSRAYTAAEVASMEKRWQDAQSKAAAVNGNDPWAKHAAEARVRRFADLLAKWKEPAAPPVQVRLQILRIGEVTLAAMPGEPFAEIGQAVKRSSPSPITMFCGYSSGEGGEYMPIESEYEHEGYEVDRTPYGRTAAAAVIREFQELFSALR
ncbi:MAG: neutral/alkaline non-lysosomal ceramidase N-terminal domain-containing protein [Bryobacteraceae bacterium]